MMEEIIHIDHHISLDEITNPIEAQLFELCESDVFPKLEIQNTEPTSSSNDHNNKYCYEGETSYHSEITKFTSTDNDINPLPPPTAIILEDDEDISASINFSPPPSFSAPHLQEPCNLSHHMMNGLLHPYAPNDGWPLGPPSYEHDCISQPACSLMMTPFLPTGNMSAPFSAENSGIFTGNGGLMLGSDLSHQDLDFQGDSTGLFLPDNLSRIFNCSTQLSALSSESQHLVHGGTSATRLTAEISCLDDPTFKVGKLSVEERKRKIHRYLQKRNERNFSKKIKYACRKTLADSRPRVRGRFAKNDGLGEMVRTAGSNHEDDIIDDDVSLFSSSIPDHQRKVVVKEEEELESADIFAHISGVNSLKCNYPIQSWI